MKFSMQITLSELSLIDLIDIIKSKFSIPFNYIVDNLACIRCFLASDYGIFDLIVFEDSVHRNS